MVTITQADALRLDDVGPLWIALQEHHARTSAHLATISPFRPGEDSWRRRRKQYEEFLSADAPAALFLAEDAGAVVGYTLIRQVPAGPTLATAERVGHLESLSVLPASRGAGTGTRLLDAAWGSLRQWGVTEVTVNVMQGNLRAEQIYRKLGMLPYTTTFIGPVE